MTDLAEAKSAADVPGRSANEAETLRLCRHQNRDESEELASAATLGALGAFAAKVAHDFNNLLTVIIGNLDLLENLPLTPPKARALSGAALSAGLRAGDLANKLLTFGERQPLDPETIDLNELLHGMLSGLRHRLGTNIEIELREGSELWPVSVDPAQLESAILSLTVNAAEAMPGGGRITIETANRSDAQGGDRVEITVADTGVGMPPDVAARAFEPFFTTRKASKASGLGLAVVYGFARQSGGTIALSSVLGQGSDIRLAFPRLQADATEASGSELQGRKGREPHTVRIDCEVIDQGGAAPAMTDHDNEEGNSRTGAIAPSLRPSGVRGV